MNTWKGPVLIWPLVCFNPISDGLHKLFGEQTPAVSVLIFVTQKPNDNFSIDWTQKGYVNIGTFYMFNLNIDRLFCEEGSNIHTDIKF